MAGNLALARTDETIAGGEDASVRGAVAAPPTPALAGSRRANSGRRNLRSVDHFLTTESWPMVMPAMAMAIAFAMLVTRTLPGHWAGLVAALSMLAMLGTRPLIRFERQADRGLTMRYLAMLAAIGGPMAGYGVAIALWQAATPGRNLDVFVGILPIVGLVAGIVLTGRRPALVVAQTSLWLGMAVTLGSAAAVALLAMGCLFGFGVAVRQSRLDLAARAGQIEAERALLRAEEILADYEQTGQGWFWETDRRGSLTYVSHTIERLLRRDADDLLGRAFTELFILNEVEREGERTLLFHLNARSSFQELAVRAAVHDEERWWSISGRPIYDGYNNFLGFRGSGHDLTEKRRSEANASRLAHYDSLTSLANRFQMSQTLEKILNAPNTDHRACAVFLLDLDRFKQVNDTMGHPAGDALLKQVAERLRSTVGTMGRVGRLGGDEFKVILPGHTNRDKLGHLARRIIEDLSQPYSIDGSRVVIGASIGIAVSPADGVTSEAVIRNADLALYAAKDRGRGCHHFYDSDLHTDAEERRQLEHDLRDALSQGGLELYYQPVVRTASEDVTGFEALLRWNHPIKGWMSPAKFVPVAEEAGLIAQVGEWALRTACRDLAKWPETVRVAVNVSPLQFANPALPAIVTSALASAQVAPHRLELEITESVFLNDDAGTDAMFAALKRVGVRLVLDDFGTGYSSLGYLKKAPFDKIKIDQSFVRGATVEGSRNGAIIAAIVSLAEALDMETTAEGVETLDELDLVRKLGCSHIQGYIYSKPLGIDHASALFDNADDDQAPEMVAAGPRSARETRRTMLRKVILTHEGRAFNGTIRNISTRGAMVEGLWDVPEGVDFAIALADDLTVQARVKWSLHGQMGVEFRQKLVFDEGGRITVIRTPQRGLERQAG